MKDKKLYKVTWHAKIYGESSVRTSSLDEAWDLAEKGEDKNFEEFDYPEDRDWEILKIQEIKDDGNPGEELDL